MCARLCGQVTAHRSILRGNGDEATVLEALQHRGGALERHLGVVELVWEGGKVGERNGGVRRWVIGGVKVSERWVGRWVRGGG